MPTRQGGHNLKVGGTFKQILRRFAPDNSVPHFWNRYGASGVVNDRLLFKGLLTATVNHNVTSTHRYLAQGFDRPTPVVLRRFSNHQDQSLDC